MMDKEEHPSEGRYAKYSRGRLDKDVPEETRTEEADPAGSVTG
jgi:hypothetical protein